MEQGGGGVDDEPGEDGVAQGAADGRGAAVGGACDAGEHQAEADDHSAHHRGVEANGGAGRRRIGDEQPVQQAERLIMEGGRDEDRANRAVKHAGSSG